MWQLFGDWYAPAAEPMSKPYAVDVYNEAVGMGTLLLTEINLDKDMD